MKPIVLKKIAGNIKLFQQTFFSQKEFFTNSGASEGQHDTEKDIFSYFLA
jgi:hypothetical protein